MTLSRSGLCLVVCAPSGGGKTTLLRKLRAEFPNLQFSVSCTTRAPRPGEVHGQDYYFLSEAEFMARRDAGDFAEWAEVHGRLYGTPLSWVKDELAAGYDLLFDIDVQGAAQLKAHLAKESVFVFIVPPSLADLEARLRGRGTDDEETIARRISNAAREIAEAPWFDFILENNDLDKAYDLLRAIYLTAGAATQRHKKFIAALLKEAKNHG